jgi:hypothetical protein
MPSMLWTTGFGPLPVVEKSKLANVVNVWAFAAAATAAITRKTAHAFPSLSLVRLEDAIFIVCPLR